MDRQSLRRFSAVVFAAALGMVFAPVLSAHAMARPAAGVINVQVSGLQDAASLADVPVEVVNVELAEVVATASTAEDGTVAFAELPLGLYQVRAIAPEGLADAASPLLYLNEDVPTGEVALTLQEDAEQEEQQCDDGIDNDGDGLIDDDDPDCDDVPAAAGFTFLGLQGGGAIAALSVLVVGAGVGIAAAAGAFDDDSP